MTIENVYSGGRKHVLRGNEAALLHVSQYCFTCRWIYAPSQDSRTESMKLVIQHRSVCVSMSSVLTYSKSALAANRSTSRW